MKRVILASMQPSAYIVEYGQDTGGPESGPIIESGEYLLYARSESEACQKFEKEWAGDIDGYAGCCARKATAQEIADYEQYADDEFPY